MANSCFSMSDFLLEIGTEEIPARMIDARARNSPSASANCSTRAPGRQALRSGLLYAAPAGRTCLRSGGASSPISASRSPVRRSRSPTKTERLLLPPRLSPRRSTFRSRAGEDHDAQGRIPGRDRTEEGPARQPRFLPKRCRKKLPASTGRRTCTGAASPPSASCVRCAGW